MLRLSYQWWNNTWLLDFVRRRLRIYYPNPIFIYFSLLIMFKSILIDGNGTTSFHAGHLSRCLGFRIIFRDPNDDTHYQPDQVDGKSFIYLLLFLIIWDLKRYREKDVILSLFCLVGGKVKKKISFVLFCFICSRTFPHAFLGSKRAPLFFFCSGQCAFRTLRVCSALKYILFLANPSSMCFF